MKGEKSIYDIWYFFQGHIREKVYYSKCRFLMRRHIQEQFGLRMRMMDRQCYSEGQCKICGCSIPALTFSDKECEGSCYPPMMSKKKWKNYLKHFNTDENYVETTDN